MLSLPVDESSYLHQHLVLSDSYIFANLEGMPFSIIIFVGLICIFLTIMLFKLS